MGRQRLNAEGLGRIMSTVQHIQTQFLGQTICPVWPFACNECVSALFRCLLQVAARASAYYADAAADRRATWNQARLAPRRTL